MVALSVFLAIARDDRDGGTHNEIPLEVEFMHLMKRALESQNSEDPNHV